MRMAGTVLLVEDELFVALDLQDTIESPIQKLLSNTSML